MDARDGRRGARRHAASTPSRSATGAAGSCCGPSAARSWSSTAPTTGSPPGSASEHRRRGHRRRPAALEGGGHCPQARDPIRVNRAILEFLDRVTPPPEPAAAHAPGPGRCPAEACLYLSSPIGLGHARRDLAIARELRRRTRTCQVDWLAQHPVTRVPRGAGERIHPASARPGERVRPLRGRGARARPACLPGDPADGRDPRRELLRLPGPGRRRRLRPRRRRRGLGRRLLLAREPRAQADAPTSG